MNLKQVMPGLCLGLVAFFGANASNPVLQKVSPAKPLSKSDYGLSLRTDREADRLKAENEGQSLAEIASKRLSDSSTPIPTQTVGIERDMTPTLTSVTLKPSKGLIAPVKTNRHNAGKVKTGVLFSREFNRASESSSAAQLTLTATSGNNYKVTNVRGLDGEITITINEAAGTVNIAPQIIYTHRTYGDLWMCPIDLNQGVFSVSDPITGTIDERGNISLSTWGLFVIEGSYKNANFGVFTESKWMPANGTINITAPNESDNTSVPTVIEQINENEINVFNIVGNANYVALRLYPGGAVQMSPQWVFTNVMYGDICVYSCDFSTGKINYRLPVNGTATPSSIKLDGWVAALRTGTGIAKQAVSTDISIEGITLTFPEAVSFALSGNGSSSNPYLLKNAADFRTLSQAVRTGNSFSGKYFALAGDVSLANLPYTWEPIGDEATPFSGFFDGRNYTVSGLTADGRGFPNVGLFGYLSDSGRIENLKMSGLTLRSSGATLGAICSTSYGKISNCHVSGRLVGTGEVMGGIVGQSVGTIEGCSFTGNIDGAGSIAGIAGLNYGQISKCHTLGTVELSGMNSSMYHQAAGIAAQMLTPKDSPRASITDCYVGGAISDNYGFSPVGGIVCLAAQSTVERCFNAATISALHRNTENDIYAGGVAAWSQGATIKDCFNAGTVIKSLGTGVEGSEMVGGIVGYLSVSYTYSSGGVTINNVSDISGCYNSGQIISSSKAGHKGIYGDTYTSNGFDPVALSIRNCWFDNQINTFDDPTFGRPTSFFTGSSLPEGLSASVWKTASGFYPILSSIPDNSSSLLAQATLTLDKSENAAKVKKGSVVKAPTGITWQFYDNNTFTDETESMKLTSRVISVKDEYGTNLLIARTTDGQMKAIQLAAVPKAFDGEGTQESPYLIKSVADMKRLDEAVEKYAQPHAGDFFRLTTDLDFSGSNFNGIGSSVYGFGGDFDGDGHTISRFSVDNASNNYWYGGLFNTALESSAIRNINLAANCSLRFFHYSGGIVGYTEGLVENCTNAAPIIQTGAYGAGIAGMVGQAGRVLRCYNSGHVVSTQPGAAGIVGLNVGEVTLCQNDGDITGGGTGEAGGIVSAHAGTIDRCVNNGDVTSFAYVGGIAGNVSTAYNLGGISSSLNNGLVEITGTGTYSGAIAGAMSGSPIFTNNWYDASINIGGSVSSFGRQGVSSASTRELISGKAFDGLPTDDFDFAAGKYPVLKLFADQPATKILRAMSISFAEGESRANLTMPAELSTLQNLTWTIQEGKNFKVEGQKLNVIVPEGMEVVNDTLTASAGTLYIKKYAIRTMPDVLEGKGSSTNPYLIRTPEDLYHLADFIDSTQMEYSDYHFLVMNDIDCTGKDFKPIGKDTKFNGTFNGNGKRIFGVNYENLVYPAGRIIGFFGTIGEKGYIKDLTLEGSISGIAYVGGYAGRLYGTIDNCINRIVPKVSSSSNGYCGGFVATANSGSLIRNSINEVSITSPKSVLGGIAGNTTIGSAIENCVNKGDISCESTIVGGIAAQGAGSFIDCRNEGKLTLSQTGGGIVGSAQGSQVVVIKNCHNTGVLTSTSGRTLGGIVGSVPVSSTIEISDCSNSANISALSYVGGIAGEIRSGTTMTRCHNSGTIIALGTNTTFTGSAGGIAGQFCGSTTNPSVMTDCYNIGNVGSHADYTGGIAGKVTSATLRDCYNLGAVRATKGISSDSKKVWETGGICGNNTGPLENCWNAGIVYSTGYAVGGVSGLPQAKLSGCFNLGDVTVVGGADHPEWGGLAGGVFGYTASTGEIIDCYNHGTITAPDYVGGVACGLSGSWTVTNCYNAGRVIATEEGASHRFEIMGPTSVSVRPSALSNVYYLSGVNSDLNANSGYDPYARGLSMAEFATGLLGGSYNYARACLPTLSATAKPEREHLSAAQIEFADGDDKNSVRSNVYLGQPGTVVWSTSDNCLIIDGKACPKELGEVVLTASTPDGEHSKTFHFMATALGGIDETMITNEVMGREYFDLSGRRIARPADGTICIVRTYLSNGRVLTEKIVLTSQK